MICPTFTRNRHVVKAYQPHEWVGPIYTCSDLGDKNPTATIWIQFVSHNDGAKAYRSTGEEFTIPYGSFVIFSEIYKSRLTAAV